MSLSFNPLDHPIIFATPRRLTQTSGWQGHIPFAMLLVELLKPKVIVELGTYYGDSYCAFCQAVQELRLPTECHGIDTWQGDPQTGTYGPEVLADLRGHHDRLYGSFSQLIQSTFDAAQTHFANGTIDLLHIDGYHTYEAVKHDFEYWLPKLSSRGVVLFHDINTRQRDFGAWILWNEIKTRFPSLEFFHGFGLGVLAVGPEQPQTLLDLMSASSLELIKLRNLFHQLSFCFWSKGQQNLLLAKLGSREGAVIKLTEQLTERDRVVQALRQTVDEQTRQLDAFASQIQVLSSRKQELRGISLAEHEHLVQRDDMIQQDRIPDVRTKVRQDEIGWLRSQIKKMRGTPIGHLGTLYRRLHAWIAQDVSPKR